MKFYFILDVDGRVLQRTSMAALNPAPAGAQEVERDVFFAAADAQVTYFYVDGVLTTG